MAEQRERVTIIGAGLMGHALALIFARDDHRVMLTDAVPAARNAALARISETALSLGHTRADVDALLARTEVVASIAEAVSASDIVIEAALERLPLKQEIFAEVERHAPSHALIASNTSVIPIRDIAAHVTSKHRVLGTHWWNPPYLVPLVEVIQTDGTSPETIATMMAVLTRLGKTPVHVRKDIPGFIGNRLQHALWREAIALVADGVCDAATLDTVVKASFGRRLAVLGPLEASDMVGTDLTLDIQRVILQHLDRATVPTDYLVQLVADGKLGFKTNEGFQTWTDERKTALRGAVRDHLMALETMLDTKRAEQP
jgi:3-hydroxybutyryl-CoA dehydrogenase